MIGKYTKIGSLLILPLVGLLAFQMDTSTASGKKAALPAQPYEAPKYDASSPFTKLQDVKPGSNIPGANKWDLWALLQVRVLDDDTRKPLPNTEVVLAENGYRVTTDKNGMTPAFPAPVIRDPRFEPTIARLHGQLTLIAYQEGYRDEIYFNVRMNPGMLTKTDMYMHRITPQDRRLEPHAYFYPTHRLFTIDLAAKYRSKTQPGAGPESPDR
ncbi:hypothetical protein [Aneurinibacillus terranovensis]|uniref:hypothetical protein n=1 Tax=Aneurinibacillus terranovensis TaxID=278991 RepID=UPI0004294E79|nr:hypothetical protein [Aneurinibacillus terranovensis]